MSYNQQGERIVYLAEEASPGRVYARRWARSEDPQLLQPLGQDPSDVHGAYTGGDGPVSLSLIGSAATTTPDRRSAADVPPGLTVANYDGGSVAVLQLRPDGGIDAPSPSSITLPHQQPPPPQQQADDDNHKTPHQGLSLYPFERAHDAPIGPVSSRQSAAYAHDTVTSPDGNYVYVPDLGTDQVHILKVQVKHPHPHHPHSKTVGLKRVTDVNCDAGSGPRHLTFYPPGQSTLGARLGFHPTFDSKRTKQFAYLVQELSTTLQAFGVGSNGVLHALQPAVSAVPPGIDTGGTPTAGPQRDTSEVVVSPDGHFVYVGTRGDPVEDHIAIFARKDDGTVRFLHWIGTGGLVPRHFSLSLDSDGLYMAVAHQASHRLTLFVRDVYTGGLTRIPQATVETFGQLAFAGFAPDA